LTTLRVGFAGTPAFAAAALQGLVDAGFVVPIVLTQPDRPAGRGMKLQASPVKQLALHQGIPVMQARSLRLDGRWPADAAQAQEALQAADLDVLVVAAYGLILPAWVLQTPRRGCVNIHASLLPRWRGAAPVQRAIEAGDRETGVTIMQMDEGLDTGDMILLETQPILADDTSERLLERLAQQGAALVIQALRQLQAGTARATPQPQTGVTYAHKIEKSESAIDWHLDARQIERRIRAFDPFPGATLGLQGQAVKLWRAQPADAAAQPQPGVPPGTVLAGGTGQIKVACGSGCLELLELQPPGGRRMDASVFLQTPLGRLVQPGRRLDEPVQRSA
jgi:methionyl-tRNA formyltransferase